MRRLMGRMILGAVLLCSTAAVAAADEAREQGAVRCQGCCRSGMMVWHGPWEQTTPYRKDDMVVYNYRIFVAVEDNFMEEPGIDASVWRQLPGKLSRPPVSGGALVVAAMGR